jgi:hypothetical protein
LVTPFCQNLQKAVLTKRGVCGRRLVKIENAGC